eukprot:c3165_g1_i1.p1 GENE.c3165_g1_i1~~c3165_g1_i1.p1  ORF type:complete len:300 (-),score=-4.87 c3165_g1_i1:77-868(-)
MIGHTKRIFSVTLSLDGSLIATGSEDRDIKIWNFNTGNCENTLLGHTSQIVATAFSPDGSHLISGSMDNTVKVWNVANGTCEQTLPRHSGIVTTVAFSPDGKTFASAAQDKTVRLYTLDGGLIHSFNRHNGFVNGVTFSADGATLASHSEDNSIMMWDVVNGKCVDKLCYYNDERVKANFPDGSPLTFAAVNTIIMQFSSKFCVRPDGKSLKVFRRSDSLLLFQAGSSSLSFKNAICNSESVVNLPKRTAALLKERGAIGIDF